MDSDSTLRETLPHSVYKVTSARKQRCDMYNMAVRLYHTVWHYSKCEVHYRSTISSFSSPSPPLSLSSLQVFSVRIWITLADIHHSPAGEHDNTANVDTLDILIPKLQNEEFLSISINYYAFERNKRTLLFYCCVLKYCRTVISVRDNTRCAGRLVMTFLILDN